MKKAIVVAHPDDEIIFFSSVIESVDKIIVCFRDCPSSKDTTNGRRLIQNRYPLKNIEWLNIKESNVQFSANWDHPTLTDYGILVGRNQNKYKKNFKDLTEHFKSKLASYDVIYTHNPWGEYGNEEHISVFKAVCSATESSNSAVYVSSYIGNRAIKVFDNQKPLLGSDLITRKTPTNLCESIKELYISTNCWTWDNQYIWPETEVFIKVRDHSLLVNKKLQGSTATPLMFLTASFKKVSFLRIWMSRLLPQIIKKSLKRLFRII